MMRVVSLLLMCSAISVVATQEGSEVAQKTRVTVEEYSAMIRDQVDHLKKERENAPTTLAEAHVRLEQTLPSETLAEIDAMLSEDDMVRYHMGLGMGIRNSWGLWADSALAMHMKELGFTHADIMSSVILKTFWCKRHGKDFRLAERAVVYEKSREAAKRARAEEQNRVKKAQAAMRDEMMELRFVKRDVPEVEIPIRRGVNVRFLHPFRSGVFLTAYYQGSVSSSSYSTTDGYEVDPADGELRLKPEYDDGVARGFCTDPEDHRFRKMKPGEDFYVQGWYFDPSDGKMHRISVPEIDNTYATAVAGARAWFAGLANGSTILVGVGAQDRITVPLPQTDEIPDLGLDGSSLMAVYSKTIYRLEDRQWTLVHSGDIRLPRSGLPPQRHENLVFFRDEGVQEMRKRLWWLRMGAPPHLSVINRDLDKAGFDGSAWYNSSSYGVTDKGDLWACGGGDLLRRSPAGCYSFAVVDNAIRPPVDPAGSGHTDPRVSVSAVTPLGDNTLLLAGRTGLYRLKGTDLVQEVAFIPRDRSSEAVGRYRWEPNGVITLDDCSYLIGCASWDGVYLLRRGDDGQWDAQFVEQGDPVTW